MADDLRPPPVAIRITRPYATEDEYLEQEIDLLSRTGITLVGAQPRPQGVVLRFELVLSGGQVLLRGEGRVVGFKPSAHQGVGGLTLRFTRIDARSKALLDKAAALRERRRPTSNRPAGPVGGSPAASSRPPGPPAPQAIPMATTPSQATAPPRGIVPPRERDALLDRLRLRAKTLDDAAVRRILEQARRHP